MPYMPCKNPDCNGYRKADEEYCIKCSNEYTKDNEVKPLGDWEEYNIYAD